MGLISNALQRALKGLQSAQWGWGRFCWANLVCALLKVWSTFYAVRRAEKSETRRTIKQNICKKRSQTNTHTTKKCFVFNTKHLLRPHSCDSEKEKEEARQSEAAPAAVRRCLKCSGAGRRQWVGRRGQRRSQRQFSLVRLGSARPISGALFAI